MTGLQFSRGLSSPVHCSRHVQFLSIRSCGNFDCALRYSSYEWILIEIRTGLQIIEVHYQEYRWSQIPIRKFQFAILHKPLLGVPRHHNTRKRCSCQGLSCTAPPRLHDKLGRRKSEIHPHRFQRGSQNRMGKALPA